MMETYDHLQQEARKIVASLPPPRFHRIHIREVEESKAFLDQDPLLKRLQGEMARLVEEDFGHGGLHSWLVSVDAGAIVRVELERNKHHKESYIRHQIQLVQIAGILHDIKRKEADHARKGAVFAKEYLNRHNYPILPMDLQLICDAIGEHEAFSKANSREKIKNSSLISNALYDADKFRWGPDNFTHTVWDMVRFAKVPVELFVKKYPAGIQKLSQIKTTFRTRTGKTFGPDFIDLGMEAGRLLAGHLPPLETPDPKNF